MEKCNLCGRFKRKFALSFMKENKKVRRVINICVDCWKDIKFCVRASGIKHFCECAIDNSIEFIENIIKEPHIETLINNDTKICGLFIGISDLSEEQNQFKIIKD